MILQKSGCSSNLMNDQKPQLCRNNYQPPRSCRFYLQNSPRRPSALLQVYEIHPEKSIRDSTKPPKKRGNNYTRKLRKASIRQQDFVQNSKSKSSIKQFISKCHALYNFLKVKRLDFQTNGPSLELLLLFGPSISMSHHYLGLQNIGPGNQPRRRRGSQTNTERRRHSPDCVVFYHNAFASAEFFSFFWNGQCSETLPW